ncbi:MAG: hypothetical protein IPH77_19515 [Ignavibacteria bacterium]|nr:hypothetical protein [Ignavibacteria bacterium]
MILDSEIISVSTVTGGRIVPAWTDERAGGFTRSKTSIVSLLLVSVH